MGIGAAPEGVLAAAGLRGSGGDIQGQLIFKNNEEKNRARDMGITDLEKIYTAQDLAQGNVMFAATGVTTGDFLQGVRYTAQSAITNTVIIRSKTGTIRWQTTEHRL